MAATPIPTCPISTIGYPMWDYFSKGKGVLLGAYTFGKPAYIAASKPPQERIQDALAHGAQIHPQYQEEFETGVAVAWHRVPWALGCQGAWTDESRDGALRQSMRARRPHHAGERACSRLPGWQEGSVLSALDAISRLHARVMAT